MVLPIRYLWEQLDGPQVSALSDAMFEYWKSIFDDKLEYFNNISIETASDIHLTLLGLLSGLVRPNISEPDHDFFYFTEFPENPTTHGFSDLNNLAVGGKFSKLDTGGGIHNVSLDSEHYRALLRAWVNGDGDIGSLMLLDDICNELTKLDLGSVTPFYRFDFMEQGPDLPSDRAPGDVYIDMRSAENWSNPLHIYAVIQGIANSAYAPQPRIFISIGTSGQVSPPVISPLSGTYSEPITVTMQVANPTNAQIYYTTDGSDPTTESTLYEGPFTVSESCIVRAIGVAPYYGNSNITRATYAIE